MAAPQFYKLSTLKQEKIIEASLKEFAECGYDGASTNRIVQEAGISKGVLFKYFDDKQSLFLHVCESVVENLVAAFPAQELASFNDLFDWLKDVTLRKIEFSIKNPLIYRLLMRVAKEREHPVYAQVTQQTMAISGTYWNEVAAQLPDELLRNGITWQHVLSAVTFITQGLQEKYIGSVPDTADSSLIEVYKPLIEELDLYFEMIQHGSYREDR